MAGVFITALYSGFIVSAIIAMNLCYLFGYIADNIIGYDIWKIERESFK